MSSIYLHIPFCKRICGYCDFFKSADLRLLDRVVDAMEEEIAQEVAFLESSSLSTIYFGGGTPSLLSIERVGRLMEQIARYYNIDGVTEVTLEANPDDLTKEYLVGLRDVGINRLSIGVQSFDDGALRFMNRRHSAQQAIQAVELAREVGFDNLAIDLIFGVSGFGGDVLARSLRQSIELGVEHIAAYHLTIEEGTLFARREARGEFEVVGEEVSEREYDMVHEVLTDGGYEHYEVSNYAREGYRSRHNSSYWRGEEYLGIGAGAHSYSRMKRRWGRSSLSEYLEGDRYDGEELSMMDRRNEVVMTSLRCSEGLDIGHFTERFGDVQRDILLRDAQKSLEAGYLQFNNNRLVIPTKHFLRSDNVIERLFHNEY